MQVHRLPALSDNYIFLLEEGKQAAVVDPADATPVLEALKRLHLELVAIFNTHHHADHVGGNRGLLEAFPNAAVYASRADQGRIPGQTIALKAGDRFTFAHQPVEVLFIPGHTSGHIAYYFPQSGNLFCGDTLFAGGCGRLFEGTPAQMVDSLQQLKNLPAETQVWCAHEYTLNNLRFAVTVEPENRALQERYTAVQASRQSGEATVPTTIGVEIATNPLLRWDSPSLRTLAKSQDAVKVFAYVRGLKDKF
ncbi:MAG: hydroxyacylglutathione hydrolase [Anaerolineae bacterium]|nr:hydroxyacylglutathione hydrolase [Gloeobacterales cyanobacterium ES-bin-313]